jgi:hypothetical protein
MAVQIEGSLLNVQPPPTVPVPQNMMKGLCKSLSGRYAWQGLQTGALPEFNAALGYCFGQVP